MSTLMECLTEIAESTERGDQTVLDDGGTNWTIESLRDSIESGPDAQASEAAQTEDIYRVVAGGRPGDSVLAIVQVDEHGYDMSPAAYVERPDANLCDHCGAAVDTDATICAACRGRLQD